MRDTQHKEQIRPEFQNRVNEIHEIFNQMHGDDMGDLLRHTVIL
jgi:hypothetical protein